MTDIGDDIIYRILLFNPKTVCTVSYDSMISFYDVDTGKIIHTITGHKGRIRYSTILKDGTLVTVGDEKMVRFWSWF